MTTPNGPTSGPLQNQNERASVTAQKWETRTSFLRQFYPDTKRAAASIVLVNAGLMGFTTINFVTIQNDSVFALLLIPVVLAGYFFGSRIGSVAGLSNMFYIVIFTVGVLGRTDTIAYVVMGGVLLTGAGYGIGVIMDLFRYVAIQQKHIARAHEELEKQLREKQMLLSEVHHRIKNNVYTLISLLDYQASITSSHETVSALNTASSRMRTMAVLYDKLYRVDSVGVVPVKDYLLTLVSEIVETLTTDQSVQWSVDADVEDFELGVNRLTIVGIIVNEAVTNAMKYAFNDQNPGQLTVSVHRNKQLIRVIVGDNGPGIPDSVKNGTEGFGMMMIHAYAEQLGGTIRFDRDRGTRCILEFPIDT